MIAGFDGQHSLGDGSRLLVVPAPDTVVDAREK